MTSSTYPAGLRERKKTEMRDRIESTALDLFLSSGFHEVTVAQIAAACDVAPQTVFNYFPAKEDLVFRRMEAFQDDLIAGVRDRPDGETVVAAFRRLLLDRQGLLAQTTPEAATRVVGLNRMIDDSPALRSREARAFESREGALVRMLADEGADGIIPEVVAHALMGVHRALILMVRRRLLAGDPPASLARLTTAECRRSLDLLERGIARL